MVYGPERTNEKFDPITGSSSSGVKEPERETDRSPPHTIEVKNIWSYTPIAFTMGAILSSETSVDFNRQTTEINSRWLSANELERSLFRAGLREQVPLQDGYARRKLMAMQRERKMAGQC